MKSGTMNVVYVAIFQGKSTYIRFREVRILQIFLEFFLNWNFQIFVKIMFFYL